MLTKHLQLVILFIFNAILDFFLYIPLSSERVKEEIHKLKRYTHLKKSVLQKSLPSLEKHFSTKVFWQSQHLTHFACHALSSTFRRNRSRMGESQPAHITILMVGKPSVFFWWFSAAENFTAITVVILKVSHFLFASDAK